MTQIKNKKKQIAGQFWKKKLFSETFFLSALTIGKEMPKIKKKNPDKMYQLIFLKICPLQQNE